MREKKKKYQKKNYLSDIHAAYLLTDCQDGVVIKI